MANSFSKKLSKYFELFLRNLVSFGAMASPMIEKVRFPAVAKISVLVVESPSLSPRGMASFISNKGVIAVKNTVSSGGIFKLKFNALFLTFNRDWVKEKSLSAKKLCNRAEIGKVHCGNVVFLYA